MDPHDIITVHLAAGGRLGGVFSPHLVGLEDPVDAVLERSHASNTTGDEDDGGDRLSGHSALPSLCRPAHLLKNRASEYSRVVAWHHESFSTSFFFNPK